MSNRSRIIFFSTVGVLALFFSLVSSCGTGGSQTTTTSTTSTTLPSGQQSVTAGGVTFIYSHDGTNLSGTLEATGTGWLAVGFSGSTMASAGKMVIGAVSASVHTVEIQEFSGRSHSPASGTVIEASGTETGGATTIFFKVSLADLGLASSVGQSVAVVLAMHSSSDSFNTQHTNRGSGTINL